MLLSGSRCGGGGTTAARTTATSDTDATSFFKSKPAEAVPTAAATLKGRWFLWRMDTHGNTMRVSVFESREAADRMRDALTSSEHKQHFWVAADSGIACPTEKQGDGVRWFGAVAAEQAAGPKRRPPVHQRLHQFA